MNAPLVFTQAKTAALVLLLAGWAAASENAAAEPKAVRQPVIATQVAVARTTEAGASPAPMLLPADLQQARLLLIFPDASTRLLSEGFSSACDPEVSFDGKRVLFSGKKKPGGHWNIYEATIDGRSVRQITRDLGDCRSPCYQGTLYTLDSPAPWHQVTFVGNSDGAWNESRSAPLTNLYSCKLDGSAVRRLTFNLSNDTCPCLLDDGRLLFASWQRSTPARGRLGHIGLFAVNSDGTDYALFAERGAKRIQRMPCVTAKGLVVFVETDGVSGDGGGDLASLTVRSPLHSYRAITRPSDGLYHSPSSLPDGRILVSRRSPDGKAPYGVYRLDPVSGRCEPVFRDPRFHYIQAKLLIARPEPDGRSSNVTEGDPHGKFYCLDVYTSDLGNPEWMPRGTAKRLRVLEGAPRRIDASGEAGVEAMAARRMLGEVPVEEDGSFNIEVPANTPIQLQLLDARGMAIRTCAWIWAKNHESRGCIGCHEDGELAPEDRFAKALGTASVALCPPPAQRRATDFRHDVLPILKSKCVGCHEKGATELRFAGGADPAADGQAARRAYERLVPLARLGDDAGIRGKYVHPGRARTSTLTWHVFGHNTSRPWDQLPAAKSECATMPPSGAAPLTESQKRVLIEWIDLGAAWNSRLRGGM